jgi:hypothetical protein
MNTFRGMELRIYELLVPVLDVLPTRRKSPVYWIGGWVGHRTGLEVVAKGEMSASDGNPNPVAHPMG